MSLNQVALVVAVVFLSIWLAELRGSLMRLSDSRKRLKALRQENQRLDVILQAYVLVREKFIPRINALPKLSYEQVNQIVRAATLMLGDKTELEGFGLYAQAAGFTQNVVTEREFTQLMELDEKTGAQLYAHLHKEV